MTKHDDAKRKRLQAVAAARVQKDGVITEFKWRRLTFRRNTAQANSFNSVPISKDHPFFMQVHKQARKNKGDQASWAASFISTSGDTIARGVGKTATGALNDLAMSLADLRVATDIATLQAPLESNFKFSEDK